MRSIKNWIFSFRNVWCERWDRTTRALIRHRQEWFFFWGRGGKEKSHCVRVCVCVCVWYTHVQMNRKEVVEETRDSRLTVSDINYSPAIACAAENFHRLRFLLIMEMKPGPRLRESNILIPFHTPTLRSNRNNIFHNIYVYTYMKRSRT